MKNKNYHFNIIEILLLIEIIQSFFFLRNERNIREMFEHL